MKNDMHETDYTFAVMIWPVQTSKQYTGVSLKYTQAGYMCRLWGSPAIVSPPAVSILDLQY